MKKKSQYRRSSRHRYHISFPVKSRKTRLNTAVAVDIGTDSTFLGMEEPECLNTAVAVDIGTGAAKSPHTWRHVSIPP